MLMGPVRKKEKQAPGLSEKCMRNDAARRPIFVLMNHVHNASLNDLLIAFTRRLFMERLPSRTIPMQPSEEALGWLRCLSPV